MSANNPIDSFPYAELTPIVGKPTFATVQTLKKQLVANAISVRSARGNGALGHAVFVLGQAAYDQLAGAGNHWIAPNNPGQAPVIPAGATHHQITQIQSQFERDTKEWETYHATCSLTRSPTYPRRHHPPRYTHQSASRKPQEYS